MEQFIGCLIFIIGLSAFLPFLIIFFVVFLITRASKGKVMFGNLADLMQETPEIRKKRRIAQAEAEYALKKARGFSEVDLEAEKRQKIEEAEREFSQYKSTGKIQSGLSEVTVVDTKVNQPYEGTFSTKDEAPFTCKYCGFQTGTKMEICPRCGKEQ